MWVYSCACDVHVCGLTVVYDHYILFVCLVSEGCRETRTPGLLDRRIGPKDMFIVLLYDCIYCQVFIKIINCYCIVY